MADLKTKKNSASVAKFTDSIANAERRKDAKALVKLYADVTGLKPTMWGPSIVGYGQYFYQVHHGNQKDLMPLAAFSPRKQNLTLYVFDRDAKRYSKLLTRLGPHATSVACLYIKRLSDIKLPILKKIVTASYKISRKVHGVPKK